MQIKYDWNRHYNIYDSSDEDGTLNESITLYYDNMFVCRIEDDYSVSTSYNSDHYLGDNYDASCGLENLFECGFGVVLALANVCPTKIGRASCRERVCQYV